MCTATAKYLNTRETSNYQKETLETLLKMCCLKNQKADKQRSSLYCFEYSFEVKKVQAVLLGQYCKKWASEVYFIHGSVLKWYMIYI